MQWSQSRLKMRLHLSGCKHSTATEETIGKPAILTQKIKSTDRRQILQKFRLKTVYGM